MGKTIEIVASWEYIVSVTERIEENRIKFKILGVTDEDTYTLINAASEKAAGIKPSYDISMLNLFDTIARHAIDRIKIGESVTDALLAIDTAGMIDDEIIFKQKMIDDLVSGKAT
jgi:hypothetical protein